MSDYLRKPAWTPPPVVVADAWHSNPSTALRVHFENVHRSRMSDLPFVNPALGVEVIDMRRYRGDWLGVLVTPWSIQLVLLPGGGELWQDISAGMRRKVALPVGELSFIADAGEDALQAYQYCPLATSVASLASMDAARRFAFEAMVAVLSAHPDVPGEGADVPAEVAEPQVDLRRRSLFGLRRAPADPKSD